MVGLWLGPFNNRRCCIYYVNIIEQIAQPGAGDGLGKAVLFFEKQYLTGSFYLYHSFSVIVAQPLSSTALRLLRY